MPALDLPEACARLRCAQALRHHDAALRRLDPLLGAPATLATPPDEPPPLKQAQVLPYVAGMQVEDLCELAGRRSVPGDKDVKYSPGRSCEWILRRTSSRRVLRSTIRGSEALKFSTADVPVRTLPYRPDAPVVNHRVDGGSMKPEALGSPREPDEFGVVPRSVHEHHACAHLRACGGWSPAERLPAGQPIRKKLAVMRRQGSPGRPPAQTHQANSPVPVDPSERRGRGRELGADLV